MRINDTIKWNEEGELIVAITNIGNVTVNINTELVNTLLKEGLTAREINNKVLIGDVANGKVGSNPTSGKQ